MMESSSSVLVTVIAMWGCGDYAGDKPPDAGMPPDAGVPDAGLRDAILPASAGSSASSYALAPTVGGYPTFGASTTVGSDGSVNVANGVWNVPVPAEVGRLIATITIPVRDNAAANGREANVVNASLVLHSSSTSQDRTLGVVSSSATGAWQTITLAAAPHPIVSGDSLVLILSPQTTTTPPHFASVFSSVGTMQVGAQRLVTRRATPRAWVTNGGTLSIVANPDPAGIMRDPVWHISGPGSYRAELDYDIGDSLIGYSVDVYGDGATPFSTIMFYSSTLGGHAGGDITQLSGDTFPAQPASWSKLPVSQIFATPSFDDGGKLLFLIETQGQSMYLGKVTLLFKR